VRITDLKTPAALVDLDVLEGNAQAMAAKAQRLGARLRPHVKTHKCVEAARIQVRGHFGGITVATMAEARHFAAAGFDDITYAVPIAAARLGEVAELAQAGATVHLVLDHPAALAEVEHCGASQGLCFSVFLKVDCGGRRAGVEPASEQALELALAMCRSRHVRLRGLLTHAGHAYACRSQQEVRAVAGEERAALLNLSERLQAAGIAAPELSLGSTPTLCAADDLGGITEVRPGNYIFFDAFQAAIGSCAADDIAFSVLATVIGAYPERGELLINAGALALSKDPGPTQVDPQCGFGLVCDRTGSRLLDELTVVTLTQEHAVLRSRRGVLPPELAIGSTLRILPNHSCLAAALFASYQVVRGSQVVDQWRPVRGW
jgi:D-serine deaminase-like pyridoxal phosphate-dependent protein